MHLPNSASTRQTLPAGCLAHTIISSNTIILGAGGTEDNPAGVPCSTRRASEGGLAQASGSEETIRGWGGGGLWGGGVLHSVNVDHFITPLTL